MRASLFHQLATSTRLGGRLGLLLHRLDQVETDRYNAWDLARNGARRALSDADFAIAHLCEYPITNLCWHPLPALDTRASSHSPRRLGETVCNQTNHSALEARRCWWFFVAILLVLAAAVTPTTATKVIALV